MARTFTTAELERTAATLHGVLTAKRLDQVRLPNLVGVGSPRCGTTFLYGLLRPQPDVYVTPVKEANYFAIGSRHRMTLREYRMLFMAEEGQRYVAEITPVYLHKPGAMEEMAQVLDHPKIIINLREPMSRLVSHFKYFRAQHGYADIGAYLEAALAQGIHVRPWHAPGRAILSSLFAEPVARAFSLFGRENCCILRHADLAQGPGAWLEQLSVFLGVPLAAPAKEPGRHPTPREDTVLPDTPAAAEVVRLFEEDAAKLKALFGDTFVW